MKASNLTQLESLILAQVQKQLATTDDVRSVVAKTVSEKVESEVYEKYSPEEYKRRGLRDGLADPDNVEITSIQSSGNKIQVILENLTMGDDSMKGEVITDTIEEGIEEDWNNPDGVWSEPRPFMEVANEELKNSGELNDAVKRALRKGGLQVK